MSTKWKPPAERSWMERRTDHPSPAAAWRVVFNPCDYESLKKAYEKRNKLANESFNGTNMKEQRHASNG